MNKVLKSIMLILVGFGVLAGVVKGVQIVLDRND